MFAHYQQKIGFAIAAKSMFSIAKALFYETTYFKYVLSYKFSQNHIELLFSRFRQKFGSNNNPNMLQFKTAQTNFNEKCYNLQNKWKLYYV